MRDGGLSTLCHTCGFAFQQRVLKTLRSLGYFQTEDGLVWIWHPLVNLYVWLTISSCYGSIPLGLGLIRRDGGLNTLCQICGLAFQQRVLKTFPGSGYLQSEDKVVWLWHPLANLYVWLTISSCYGLIPLALGMIVRDDGLSTLCHSCGFACQERVLKTFPRPGNLHSEDDVVWLWHPPVNFFKWLIISCSYGSIPLVFVLIVRDGVLSTICHSCGFSFQQRVRKTFRGSAYFHSEDGVVLLWHPLVNLYGWLTISSRYGSIPWGLGLVGRDTGLSTLCHSCGLAFQQSVLKAFPASGYLYSEDEVVWLWHPLVSFYVWLIISFCYGSISLGLGLIGRDGGLALYVIVAGWLFGRAC